MSDDRIDRELRAIRPGITARTHHVEGLGAWGELEVRGVLASDLSLPPIPTFDAREHVDVAHALAASRTSGASAPHGFGPPSPCSQMDVTRFRATASRDGRLRSSFPPRLKAG